MGDQNELYNSAVFCSSDISDGNRHNHDDMPIVLGGHGGGKLNPGQHVSFTPAMKSMPKQKVSNLLVTMLEAGVVTGAQLGDSTGALTGL